MIKIAVILYKKYFSTISFLVNTLNLEWNINYMNQIFVDLSMHLCICPSIDKSNLILSLLVVKKMLFTHKIKSCSYIN